MTTTDQQPLGRVQRTLILSCGDLASRCGAQFETLLTERGGPTVATAVVTLKEGESVWETAVAAALNRISPPDLAARLAQSGWQLGQPPALHLIILLSPDAERSPSFPALATTAANRVYQQLGLEPLLCPIWLVGDGVDLDPLACQMPHYPLPVGSLVLGLCNQAGLRLPDEESLCAVAAELLWVLTATPLLAFLEQRQAELPPEGPTFLTAGLHAWTWSPNLALAQFVQRWRRAVVAHWLSDSIDEDSLLTVPGWLQTQQLTPKQFASYALREREATLPQLPEADWQMPWPWQIPALFEKSRFENSIDEEATTAYAKQAQLRLFDPLQQAGNCLHAAAFGLLNGQPVAGIAQTLAWLQAVADACEGYLPTLFEWETRLNETADSLSVARGEREGWLKDTLSGYPATVTTWLPFLWRPWRWPGQALRYWRLQKAGQQLCQLYSQQATVRRQRIAQQTAYHGVIELLQIVRRLGNQVAEIGEMLHSRLRTDAAEPPLESTLVPFPLAAVPLPETLYEQLLPDMAAEAITAAAAVGGLGHQIRHLDDIIFDQLTEVAQGRLAHLAHLAPADLLLAQERGEQPSLATLLQDGWATASPLWPVDVATLDETARLHQTNVAVLCGSQVLPLSTRFTEMTDTMFTLASGWPHHLWLIRFHIGLPATAVTSGWQPEVTIYE